MEQGSGATQPVHHREPNEGHVEDQHSTEMGDAGGATGISGLHSRLTRGKASSRGETKCSALLSSRAAAAKSLQSCPTLCDLMDGSPPGSPVPGILRARTLEWVPFPSSMQPLGYPFGFFIC